MSINVKCEGCGKILSVPDGCEGLLIQCATCDKRMRVPNKAPQTAAEPAQPVAPASGDAPDGQDAFLRALAEEAAREQRQADVARAAKANVEAELAPLPEAAPGEPGYAVTQGPVPPAAPSPVAPAGGDRPEDKDALFKILAEEAAREHSGAVQAAKTGAGAYRAPSPEALVRGQSAAAKELRIKTAADKSGYAVASDAAPASPGGSGKRRQPLRTLVGVAGGLLLLIVVIVALSIGFSSRKPRVRAQPILVTQPAPQPEAAPEFPAALKEAAQALAAKAPVEVEVVEASAGAAAPPMPVLTPTGDLMLEAANLHIRDKDDADAGIQEMRSASRATVYEGVAAILREKGLAPAEAGQSTGAANPGELRSRLKVFFSTAPAWARFNFSEGGTPPVLMPSRPGRPGRGQPGPNFSRRGPRAAGRGPAMAPPSPVRLWEKLVSGGLTINAQFIPGAAEIWYAVPSDDAQADPLPCGLRISIVRVVWEVGGQTHEMIGGPVEADAALSDKGAETGAAPPFHRPKQLREIHLTGQMGPDRACLLSGFCQYDDLDLHADAAEAGKLAAGLLAAPEADWQTLWDGKADKGATAAACRNILRLGGGPAIAGVVTATPDRLPHPSADALVAVLKEERSSPEWAGPFLALRGPFGDAAMVCLARQAKEENQKDFLQWVATPADHSPESVQAATCALIDLGRPGPEVNALIDKHAVKAFSEVRQPRASLMFPPQTAQTVLEWLIRSGTPGQRVDAAVTVVTEGNLKELQDDVRAFVGQSLGPDPETLYSLCKGIEKEQSPMAFEILSSVARLLMQSDAGDRFPPPAALAEAGARPPAEQRYSRTVAALVCAGLARFDRFEAGKVLVGLIQSPGPATRYCAIETLMTLDDVDVSKEIRARYEALSHQARNAYEEQEWELLNPVKNKLCRYDVPMISAENALKNGVRTNEVIETCDGIIKDNPSPTLVERAREMKRQAEKALQLNPGAAR